MDFREFNPQGVATHFGKWSKLVTVLIAVGFIVMLVALFSPVDVDVVYLQNHSANEEFAESGEVHHTEREMSYVQMGQAEYNRRYRWHSYLTSVVFYASIALGGFLFVCIQHLTRAGWSVVIRRLAEATMMNIGLVLLFLLPVILFHPEIFLWAKEVNIPDGHWHHAWHKKHAYLNSPFFVIRFVIYAVLWFYLSRFLFKKSISQDRTKSSSVTLVLGKLSALCIIVYGLTSTFFAFDMIMSLEYAWFSTIFGVIFFAGCFIGLLSFVIIASSALQVCGYLRGVVTAEHRHDLGKLLFAFVIFWAYVSFSQFLLIRYPDIPEETVWYLNRYHHQWDGVTWAVLVGHFVVPFFALLSRHIKRCKFALTFMAVYMLVFHYIDLYWHIMPTVAYPNHIKFSFRWVDVLVPIGMGLVFIGGFLHLLKRRYLVPVGDPRLKESLEFRNH